MKYIVKHIASISILFFIILQVGCNSTVSRNKELISVEQLMSERPDSALVILQSIDTLSLKSSADKALYSLLYVQAQDKNYIDTQDATQIQRAVIFYKNSSDEYHKMLSYYYLARIQENTMEYSKAIINLLEAEESAKKINDQFYLGLIYRSCSNIYDKIYNNVESLNYAKQSYNSFKESKRWNYDSWALWRLGCAHHNTNNYDQCIAIMLQVAEVARANNDTSLYIEALKSRALSHLALHEYNDVLSIYNTLKRIDDFKMGISDYQNLGLAYIGVGDDNNAKLCMNEVFACDSAQQWLPYELSKRSGDYQNALYSLEIEHSYQDSILQNILTQNVTQMVSNYRAHVIKLQENELLYERRMTMVMISVLAIIIALASVIFIQRIKTQNKEIENNMLKASNLRNLLQIKEMKVNEMNAKIMSKDAETVSLQEKLDESEKLRNTQLQTLNTAINNLFEQSFTTIDKLTSAYYEYQGTINEKQKIYSDVMGIMSKLSSDKKVIYELEKFVNQYRNNLMIRFRTNFPEFKEADCVLFLYIIAGFSSRAISIFINEKLDVVYNRKSRLKQKIIRSNSPEKEIFVKHIR